MTELIKKSRRRFIPGSPGVPASPGSPGKPGHWESSTQRVCGFVGGVVVRVPTTSHTLGPGYVDVVTGGSWVCTDQPVQVWIPATAGTPPSPGVPSTPDAVIEDNNLGWNSGAVSIKGVNADGGFSFQVDPSVVGIVAGLAGGFTGTSINEVTHGFLLQGGVVSVIESGAEQTAAGTYNSSTVFKILRQGRLVTYYKDDVAVYVSTDDSVGAVFLDVYMYSAYDRLFNAELIVNSGSSAGDGNEDIGDLPTGDGSTYGSLGALLMRPMLVSGSDATDFAHGSMSFRPMRVYTEGTAAGDMHFEPLVLIGAEDDYAQGSVRFEPMTVSGGVVSGGDGPVVPHFAIGECSMSPMRTDGISATGEVANGSMSFRPFFVLGADRPYSQGDITFEPAIMWGESSPPTLDVTMLEHIYVSSGIGPYAAFDVTLRTHLGSVVDLGALLVYDGSVLTHLRGEYTVAAQATLNAVVDALITAHASLPLVNEDGETWVVNDESGASTTYENFDFNSFCKFQGEYLAVRSDGLYKLGSDEDNGEPIHFSLDFGVKTFGSTALKTIENCYVGVASTGAVFLKVIVDGKQFVYRTKRIDKVMSTQVITPGKGLKASHLSFEIYNQNGADLELDSVEFEIAVLSRRN